MRSTTKKVILAILVLLVLHFIILRIPRPLVSQFSDAVPEQIHVICDSTDGFRDRLITGPETIAHLMEVMEQTYITYYGWEPDVVMVEDRLYTFTLTQEEEGRLQNHIFQYNSGAGEVYIDEKRYGLFDRVSLTESLEALFPGETG